MNYEPAIRVLLDYAGKARQAAARSGDAGFPGNATHCQSLADIYDASADLLRESCEVVESTDLPSVPPECSAFGTTGSKRCEDSFLSSLGVILG